MTTEREDAGLRDAQVSARYRELAREEPPARLDAAILGAARSSVARPGMRRWAVPVSLAAVVVLSVLVTMRIHEEAPEFASVAPEPAERRAKPAAPAATTEAKPAGKSAQEAARPLQGGQMKVESDQSRADAAPRSAEKREAAPFAPPPAPGRAVEAEAASPAKRSVAGAAPGAAAGSLAESMAARERPEGGAFEESPQKWLAHIARLRDAGRDAEADKSLERFRRRFPDYRIPEEMRAKVLPR